MIEFTRDNWEHGEGVAIIELCPDGEPIEKLSRCKKFSMQGRTIKTHRGPQDVWIEAQHIKERTELTGVEAYKLFVAERVLYCPILIQSKLYPYFMPGTYAEGGSPLLGPKYLRAGCVVSSITNPRREVIVNPNK